MSKMRLFAIAVLLPFAFRSSGPAAAQDLSKTPEQQDVQQVLPEPAAIPPETFKPQGRVITPPVSVSSPGNGVHTNYKIFVPAGHQVSFAVPDVTFAEYPASMACVYGVGPSYAGCVPANNGKNAVGGWGAIAVVDAYDDPNAAADLAHFSAYFGLPAANFKKVIANSTFGPLNGLSADCAGTPANAKLTGWDLEESLDIEWAHAMAPNAQIVLVEACDQNLESLLFAEEVAGIEVGAAGGGDISNSWGFPEACAENPACNGGLNQPETADDNYFFRYYWKNITYFASAGDSGAEVLYPSASPWVVSAGGTTVNRDSSGNFLSESCWADSGGGYSTVEKWQNPANISDGMGPWSNYQYELFGGAPFNFPFRSTPDISFNADPSSGVWVYDTDSAGAWYIVGGTSVSSPALAGIVNASNNRLGQAPAGGGYYETHENEFIYSQLNAANAYKTNFYDVVAGTNGHAAGAGYDQCTGVGSPRGHLGK